MTETTFADMFEIMKSNGWEKITPIEYIVEKRKNKRNTARIGDAGFFRLKERKQVFRFQDLNILVDEQGISINNIKIYNEVKIDLLKRAIKCYEEKDETIF